MFIEESFIMSFIAKKKRNFYTVTLKHQAINDEFPMVNFVSLISLNLTM